MLLARGVAGGGENAIPASLLDELKQLYTGSIIVALDCDAKGRTASQKLVSQLRLAGYTAYAVDLNLGAGGDIADYCKLYQHESMQQLLTLKPPSQEVEYKTTFNTTNDFVCFIASIKFNFNNTIFIVNRI